MQAIRSLLLVAFLLPATAPWVLAQKMFTEGKITYAVSIKAPDTRTATQHGLFTITIKNNRVVQRLEIEGGYTNVSISSYRTGKYISLRKVNNTHYAIEMDLQTIVQNNAGKKNAKMTDGKQTRQLHQYTIHAASLIYKNGEKFPFFYLPDFQLEHPEIFEAMPDLKGIPAIFELPMNRGFNTRFELMSIVEMPIENSAFQVPEGYRVISEKEYRNLIR